MKKSNPYHCTKCNLTFDNWQIKANHIRWQHNDNSSSIKKMKESSTLRNDNRYGKIIYETIKCSNIKCVKLVNISYRNKTGKRKKYFCCRSCANSRIRTDEYKILLSNKMKDLWLKGHYDDTTAKNWMKLPKLFSSKREREIVKHFKTNYITDEWKSGGQLKVEGCRLVRDLWSDKLKICFEYDGDWHFLDLNGQLKNKQLKDALLETWCVNNGYRLIRIDERTKLSIEEIEKLIYTTNTPILKIGNRY